MRMVYRMPIDTLFGNRLELEVTAELTNIHDPENGGEATKRLLLQDMVRVLNYAVHEVESENARLRAALRDAGAAAPPH